MKWIGQHIQSLISRFRNDVYLEGLSTTTEANVLVVDSTGKISKNTSVGGDLTSIVAGTGLSGTSLTGPIPTLDVDASQTQITGVGTIGTGTWQGTAITKEYINADQRSITQIGTIATGVWQGTAIASAYLDADTMHYSAQRQLTHHMILDDIDTSVVYISLMESDAENVTASNKHLPIIAPVAGKLLKVFLRSSHDMSGVDLTWKLYTRPAANTTNGNGAEIGAKTGTGPDNREMLTYDFTTSLDSGTNVVNAGDKVLLSIQGSGSTPNANLFMTLLWEWDLS